MHECMVSGGPCLHVAHGVIMLFVYVVSCMRYAWVVWSSSAGYFKWMLWGISHSLSDSKCKAILPQVCIKVYIIPKFGVSKFINLLSFYSRLSHTCSCSLTWPAKEPSWSETYLDCTLIYGQKLPFLFIRDVVIISRLFLSQFFFDQRFFFMCETFFPLGIVAAYPKTVYSLVHNYVFIGPSLLILVVASFVSAVGELFIWM